MSLGRQLVAPPCAAAQTVHGAARVNTFVDACVPIDPDQFHRVLAIELGTSIEYSPTAARQPGGTLVRLVCTDGAVQLQLEDSLTRKSMQRVVELPAVDIATRSRLLALSVAEFVVASWVELRLSAQAPLAPAGPPVPDAAAQRAGALAAARLPTPEQNAASEAEDSLGARWILGVSVEPMFFTQGSRLLPQLSLHLEQRPSAHVALELSLSLGHASWNVHWPTQNAAAANVTASSGRLSFGYVASLAPVELSVRAGARGGVVFMAGSTNRLDLLAEELYAPWGGPVLLLTAATSFGPVRALLELEAGYVTLPAEALIKNTNIVVAELSGFWGSLGLGLGWIF